MMRSPKPGSRLGSCLTSTLAIPSSAQISPGDVASEYPAETVFSDWPGPAHLRLLHRATAHRPRLAWPCSAPEHCGSQHGRIVDLSACITFINCLTASIFISVFDFASAATRSEGAAHLAGGSYRLQPARVRSNPRPISRCAAGLSCGRTSTHERPQLTDRLCRVHSARPAAPGGSTVEQTDTSGNLSEQIAVALRSSIAAVAPFVIE